MFDILEDFFTDTPIWAFFGLGFPALIILGCLSVWKIHYQNSQVESYVKTHHCKKLGVNHLTQELQYSCNGVVYSKKLQAKDKK